MYRLLAVTVLGLFLTLSLSNSTEAQPREIPTLSTTADSVAYQVYEALGGPEAWNSLQYLRFTFAVEDEGNRQPVAHHLWNRDTGDYRVEWSSGEGDTTFVVLFNVNSREGSAYADGVEVSSERTSEMLDQAYRRYINDTYWMLAPVKLLDEGVNRTYLPDSSSAETAVLHLNFGDVGLTPGDEYWHYIDRETYRVQEWAYHLQSYPEDRAPSHFRWMNYQQFEAPEGSIWIATRKQAIDGSRAILTDQIDTPAEVADEMFTNPEPQF